MKNIRTTTLSFAEQEEIQRDPPSVVANDERWSVLLSADYTMQEMAAMMGGLASRGIEVEALPLGDGVLMLRPMWPHHEAPSAVDLLLCMRDGARAPVKLEVVR